MESSAEFGPFVTQGTFSDLPVPSICKQKQPGSVSKADKSLFGHYAWKANGIDTSCELVLLT